MKIVDPSGRVRRTRRYEDVSVFAEALRSSDRDTCHTETLEAALHLSQHVCANDCRNLLECHQSSLRIVSHGPRTV